MNDVQSHRDLVVWQKSMDMVVMVYHLAKKFPPHENYGLTSQTTRAAISVPGNIAEGSARGTTRDFLRFLAIAKGSLMETETYLMLSTRLGYTQETDTEPALSLVKEISKMLTAMTNKLVSRL